MAREQLQLCTEPHSVHPAAFLVLHTANINVPAELGYKNSICPYNACRAKIA